MHTNRHYMIKYNQVDEDKMWFEIRHENISIETLY